VDGQLVLNTSALILNAALADFGLAYLIELQVQKHLDSGELGRCSSTGVRPAQSFIPFLWGRDERPPPFRFRRHPVELSVHARPADQGIADHLGQWGGDEPGGGHSAGIETGRGAPGTLVGKISPIFVLCLFSMFLTLF
jgi:hypothetical protein